MQIDITTKGTEKYVADRQGEVIYVDGLPIVVIKMGALPNTSHLNKESLLHQTLLEKRIFDEDIREVLGIQDQSQSNISDRILEAVRTYYQSR